MRKLLQAVATFGWVVPVVELTIDATKGGTPFIMDDANYLKAITVLKNVGYRGGHVASFSNAIIVDDKDAAEVERQLSAAGVTWK